MKINIKETSIHILIWIVLFCIVFLATFLSTQRIKEDISQIRIDINEISHQLEIDLSD